MNTSLVPYDVAHGSQGLRLMIQARLKRHFPPTKQSTYNDAYQAFEHKRATEIFVKHDPSYRCSCSLCRI